MKTGGIAALAGAAVSCYYVEALCPLAMGAAVAVFTKAYQSHGKLPPPGPGLPPVAPGAHVMPLSNPSATSIYWDTNNNAYFNPATKTFYNPTYQLYYDPSTNQYTDRQGNVVPPPGASAAGQ